MDIYKKHAMNLLALGYRPVPCHGKRPVVTGWQTYSRTALSEDQVSEWSDSHGSANIGLVCGESLTVVDIDEKDEALAREIMAALPRTPMLRKGAKGFAAFYRGGTYPKRRDDKLHFDYLSTGSQVIVPPSIHPDTKNAYRWIGQIVEAEDLPPAPSFLEVQKIVAEVKDKRAYTPIATEGVGRNSALVTQSYKLIRQLEVGLISIGDAVLDLVQFDELSHMPPWFTDRKEHSDNKRVEQRAAQMLARLITPINKRKEHDNHGLIQEPLINALNDIARGAASARRSSDDATGAAYSRTNDPGLREATARVRRQQEASHGTHPEPKGTHREEYGDTDDSGIRHAWDADEDSDFDHDAGAQDERQQSAQDFDDLTRSEMTGELIHQGGLIFQSIHEESTRQSQAIEAIDFGAALSLTATLASHKLVLGKTWPHQYVFVAAPSGVGKTNAQTLIKKLVAHVADLASRLVPAPISGAACRILVRPERPVALCLMDEFHKVLELMSRPDSKSPWVRGPENLNEIFSSAESILQGATAKTQMAKEDPVSNPCLTLYATGTTKGFLKALSPELFQNGLFGRIYFCIADYTKQQQLEMLKTAQLYGRWGDIEQSMNPEVLARVAEWSAFDPITYSSQYLEQSAAYDGSKAGVSVKPVRLAHSEANWERLLEIHKRLGAVSIQYEPVIEPMLNRVQEHVNKLCMSWVISHMSPAELAGLPTNRDGALVIPEESLDWAYRAFLASAGSLMRFAGKRPELARLVGRVDEPRVNGARGVRLIDHFIECVLQFKADARGRIRIRSKDKWLEAVKKIALTFPGSRQVTPSEVFMFVQNSLDDCVKITPDQNHYVTIVVDKLKKATDFSEI